ncbi:hypothetical protein AB0315_07470 [Micrococcus luteus]|uniref:hypothetical protein n=1 Tax=Micrococcus luteus TaxID=1270 RepID=UPI00344D759B
MAGQFCFCGDFGRGVDVGVGKDAGGGLVGCVGGVFFIVDGDTGEQGAVKDASFGWFALVVEVVEVDQEFGELVQAWSGVGVGEVVEPGGDLVEAGADAVLLALEDVEWDRVGVVGLDEFEVFGFELVALGSQELAFVLEAPWVSLRPTSSRRIGPCPRSTPPEFKARALQLIEERVRAGQCSGWVACAAVGEALGGISPPHAAELVEAKPRRPRRGARCDH